MRVLLSDFSRVLLFPKDRSYEGSLNTLYKKILEERKDFKDYFDLNTALLDFLKDLNVKKYVFTTGTVQEAPEIVDQVNSVFEKVFTVPEVGFQKNDPQSYTRISDMLDISTEDILFIDDQVENVNAARVAGVKAFLFENFEQFKYKLVELGVKL